MAGMIFSIYTRLDGGYVFVPSCMQASMEAERLHGPLRYLDSLEWSEGSLPAVWDTVMAEVDAHSFAVLQDAFEKYLTNSADSVD